MTHDTLSTLLEQAESQRNRALAAFNDARARRDAARRQAADLVHYRDDYTQRWQAQFARQAAAQDILRCYREFAGRLELALSQQAHAVALAEQTLARANDTLAAHELRVASVRKLLQRRQQEQRRVGERHEQRAADELAQRPQAGTTRALRAFGASINS
jgi:flagellar protein FliJ